MILVSIESCHCISYEQSCILNPSVNTNVKYRKLLLKNNINFDETDQPLNLYSPFFKYNETWLS